MPLINDNYSYRCVHRKCPVLMAISKSELSKLNFNTNGLEINVVYINEHNLNAHKNIKAVKENSNIFNVIKSNKDLCSELIEGSINKPLEWHITNIQNNNINFTKNQMKFLLYKYGMNHIQRI